MAYNTKEVVKDVEGNPISQYYNPITDNYEPVEGFGGGNKVVLYNEDGTENNELSLIPILDKLSQLTGTVIDEETRKSNELLRIAFYNQLQQMLLNGDFIGAKGDIGLGLEFNWDGTSLGVRIEGQQTYAYIDLKGNKGDKGDTGGVDGLTDAHVKNALGYTPANETDIPTVPTQVSAFENDSGYLSSVNKGDVDLGNVDNVKQMPISNGVLENYREKLVSLSGTTTAINLSLGNVFTHTLSGNTTYTITNAVSGQAHSFTLIITQTATVRTLTFPASVKWQGGEIPDLSNASKTYILTFMTVNGGTAWLGMSGGEF